MNKVVATILGISLAGNLSLAAIMAVTFVNSAKEQGRVQETMKAVKFQSLFLEKILLAESEVDFETQVLLENAIRDLGDDALVEKWRAFTVTEDRNEARDRAKELLRALAGKTLF